MPAGDELSDLALLRRFEPVIKYTQGELFLPGDVNDYVGSASLQAASLLPAQGGQRVQCERPA
ncbi:MAG TPA: hypothetical protein PLB21_09440, partial [Actinomycetota bacterium]|nr:hypothetical protein [Actinomycetota bacterium]